MPGKRGGCKEKAVVDRQIENDKNKFLSPTYLMRAGILIEINYGQRILIMGLETYRNCPSPKKKGSKKNRSQ